MGALQIGQPVTLELDGGLSPLDCVVTAIAGETATLVQTRSRPLIDFVLTEAH